MGKRWINMQEHCNDCHLINGKWYHLAGNLLWDAHKEKEPNHET